MKFLERESAGDAPGGINKPRAEVYRLGTGQVVYIERDINVAGWARITRLSTSADSGTVSSPWSRWTYSCAADAAHALAEWDPDIAPAPAGWFLSGQAKTTVR